LFTVVKNGSFKTQADIVCEDAAVFPIVLVCNTCKQESSTH
jgi:hypothetical protein